MIDQGPTPPSGRSQTSLGVIFLVLFADLIGFSIIFPLYAEMLAHYLRNDAGLLAWAMSWVDHAYPGASFAQRAALFGGILGAAYATLQFLCAPAWGRLSDRIGRRPVLLFSIAGTALANVIWVFSGEFTMLLLSRLLAGVMTGNVSVANAAVADITTPQTRARGMGLIGMAFGLGFILGPAIGGLAYHYLPRVDDAATGWLTPFSTCAAIAAALSMVNLVWAFARFRETLPPERRVTTPAPGRTANPIQLFNPALGIGVPMINLAFTLHTLLFAGMEATLVFLSAEKCGYGPAANGALFAAMGFLSAMMQGGVFRRLSPRVGERPLAAAGFIILVPGFLLIGLVDWYPHPWLLWTGVIVLACGTGLVFPALNTMASLAGDPQRQGWVLGTFRSAGSLGRAAGPLLGALIYFMWRPAAPYLVGAIGMLLPLIIIMRVRLMR
ncbi:MAG: MFS transporter [Planctomycetes bacterium]|nr:MFS transporter [Planctomycetota bacterium]